ncbi:BACON domain-containing protein [Streptomyces griseocarneus]|uniref:BACON domain-containing protein n=1 Tax=Streptomyces griseocarneus TaxID=51201 RepID=UPI00167D049E|nr:hypothetical protein [Streptomyces griseocarneus]MBZ6477726.1 hypothetical protein [Streptomyces griseocarneus]GHG81678.1 hypothetical protein GCM10018779_63940 [Streptomyces griseocarneus]
MMTPEPPTHATGAHRASRRAPRAAQPPVVENPAVGTAFFGRPAPAPVSAPAPEPAAPPAAEDDTPDQDAPDRDSPEQHDSREHHDAPDRATSPEHRYEPHLDGLFTYCLSVLCDHDAAVAALGEVLALAVRRTDRAPAAEETHRAWLYALARWECLRRLAAPGAPPADPSSATGPQARAELALLAWPEAAGTTAAQREALELAVRHGLAPHEVAAVLRMDHEAARALLSSAACEVERTRTALAVVESGRCATVTRFVGDTEVLLGAALRRELVRHVDECADCRRTAERATAGEPWPGTAASSAPLPVLAAPRAAVHSAMLRALGPRPARRRGATAHATPRFDRGGFPLAPKDRAARRGRLRSRAVTTTVVATVVAAPVLALWAAYRGGPLGEGQGAASVSAPDSLGGSPDESSYDHPFGYEEEAAAESAPPTGRPAVQRLSEVSVAVLGTGPGRLTVEAQPGGAATHITLTASGGELVSWSMSADAPWLRLSQPGGVLRPGQTVTVVVTVDRAREPARAWRARVAIAPGGSVVTLEGKGGTLP